MSFLFDLFSNDKAKFRRDLETTAKLFRKEKREWVPFEDDEIESIALKIQKGKKKRLSSTSYKSGEIRSIFHELLGSFLYRTYGKSKGFLAVQTNPYTYAYWVKPKYVEVRINGQRFTYMLADGTIKNAKGNKIIGHIDFRDPRHPEVEIGDEHFGILNQHNAQSQPHERAVQMMRAMPEGIQELFLAVTLFYMVVQQTDIQFVWNIDKR